MVRRLIPIVSLALIFCAAGEALAQQGKVAYVNFITINAQSRQGKDYSQKISERQQSLQQELNTRKAAAQALDEARKQYKPESQQYHDKNAELMRSMVELRSWGEVSQQDLSRERKQQLADVYAKAKAAAETVAKQRGFEMVMVDDNSDIPPGNIENAQINPDQFFVAILQRHVLYVDPKVDITNDVIAQMDKDYQAPAGNAAPAK